MQMNYSPLDVHSMAVYVESVRTRLARECAFESHKHHIHWNWSLKTSFH